jgi:ribonuclease HI
LPSVTISTDECSPDLDIAPPGRASISRDGDDALFHDAAGRFRGRTTAANANDLWKRWAALNPAGTTAGFCQRVIHLFQQHSERAAKRRTRDRRGSPAAAHQPKAKHQRSLPEGLVSAMHECFSISQELFSSPFNVHPNTPRFCTPLRSDADFAGASPDAFSSRWAGAALIHPEFEDACLAKAARHAISAAAHGPDACLFIFVAPRWPTKAFHRALVHSHKAHLLFSTPGKRLNTTMHQHGPLPTANAPYHWPMDVWLIANDAGLDSYYVASSFPAFQLQVNAACSPAAGVPAGPSRAASVVTEKPTTYTWLAQEAADPTHRAPRPPRRLRGRAPHPAVDAQPTHHAAPRLPSLEPLSERAPAFPHAAGIIYTDGSLKKNAPHCGCGVFTASSPGTNASFQFTGEQTIMRAELSAIAFALGRAAPADDVTIATDSLSSLQAIRKALNKPHRITRHRSAKLLQQIAQLLQRRHAAGGKTHLCKVKSHSDIKGNEEADTLAKSAVDGDCTIPTVDNPQEITHRFDWQTRTAGGRAKLLQDGKQLAQAATDARTARVRAENPKTPAAKWAAAATTDGLMHAASNAFRNGRDVTFRQKCTLLQLRCNRWVGNGLKHKWKLAPSPRCPHCTSPFGNFDDGLHSATCCRHSQLAGMITFRHDKAVHLVVSEVQKAHHERPFHLFVSAGRRFQESSAPLTATIPAWALPAYPLKPDLVLVLGWSEDMPVPAHPTTDIEFVICDLTCGYGHTSARRVAKKQAKYDSLVRALRQRGWAARAASPGTCLSDGALARDAPPRETPMTTMSDDDGDDSAPPPPPVYTDIFVASFGVTGEVYQSTAHSLRALGIDDAALKSLLAAIHLHIVRDTCKILTTRRKLDALLQQQPQQQPASARRGEG